MSVVGISISSSAVILNNYEVSVYICVVCILCGVSV